jgi:hypothetical protein
MSDFIIVERDLKKFPDFLLGEVPDFLQAREFLKLTTSEVHSPSLLTAAFTCYFERLHGELRSGAYHNQAEIDKGLALIEKLAQSSDPAVQNLVVVEVFDNLNEGPTLRDIEVGLKGASSRLYREWRQSI